MDICQIAVSTVIPCLGGVIAALFVKLQKVNEERVNDYKFFANAYKEMATSAGVPQS